MRHYQELKVRANAQGIETFGDIVTAMGVDVSDIWPDAEPVDLTEYLYWCDGAAGALECLAEEGLI